MYRYENPVRDVIGMALNKDLLQAIESGDLELVKKSKVRDFDSVDEEEKTYLHHACACNKGSAEIVDYLIQKGADMNAKDNSGKTALMRASMDGRAEAIDKLIEFGADVNAKDNSGKTALIRASIDGRKEAIDKLIEFGADVNVKDNKGKTALDIAKGGGHTKLVMKIQEFIIARELDKGPPPDYEIYV